jgi:hypothetical protein
MGNINTDPGTFCFEETATGAVRSRTPLPQVPPLGSAALAELGTLSPKFAVTNMLRGKMKIACGCGENLRLTTAVMLWK